MKWMDKNYQEKPLFNYFLLSLLSQSWLTTYSIAPQIKFFYTDKKHFSEI